LLINVNHFGHLKHVCDYSGYNYDPSSWLRGASPRCYIDGTFIEFSSDRGQVSICDELFRCGNCR
jgi:hypothetical protein